MDFIDFIFTKRLEIYTKNNIQYNYKKKNEYTIVLFNKILMPNYRHQSFG